MKTIKECIKAMKKLFIITKPNKTLLDEVKDYSYNAAATNIAEKHEEYIDLLSNTKISDLTINQINDYLRHISNTIQKLNR